MGSQNGIYTIKRKKKKRKEERRITPTCLGPGFWNKCPLSPHQPGKKDETCICNQPKAYFAGREILWL